ncbi:MAG: hypothetical protein M3R04_00490, partial [bacterium]|nr:hypothetical protein [bacterium]
MRVGISGLAVSNAGGLGRLARTAICALASARPDWELHIYLRGEGDIEALHEECGATYAGVLDQATVHLPPPGWRARLLLEELDLPRRFATIKLDAYLGLDFTLATRRLAPIEAVMVPDLLPFTQPKSVSWKARWLYRRGLRQSLQLGARIVCISEQTRERFVAMFERHLEDNNPVADWATLNVIHPALSPKLLALAESSAVHDRPLQVRGSHASFSGPGQYLLYVGDFGPRKNVKLLVDVYRSMVEQGKYGGSLVLAGGDGRY